MKHWLHRRQGILLPVTCALLGLIWFLLRFGFAALQVSNIDWLMSGDWYQHTLGFLHYRLAPWEIPLGTIPTLAAPVGTHVGFTDSIPFLSFLLKPLDPWLPVDFQFIGPWLCLCFMVQGILGGMLGRLITAHFLGALLVAGFFITSPVLHLRVIHPSLCTQFLLLWVLYFHLSPVADYKMATRRAWIAVGLVFLAAGIHPFLWVMAVPLVLTLLWTYVRREGLGYAQAAIAGVALVGASLAVFYLWGMLGTDALPEAGGLGYYNADLATLFHPMDSSRLIPRLPSGQGAYEGLGYLGTGILVLGLWVPGLLLREGEITVAQIKRHLGLGVLCLLLTVLAYSVTWRLFGKDLWNLESITTPLHSVLKIFRSSGRFIWPLHYLAITAILAAFWHLSRLSRPVLLGILGCALVLQIADLRLDPIDTQKSRDTWYHMNEAVLRPMAQGKQDLVLIPPRLWSNGPGCDGKGWPDNILAQVMYFAYRQHLATSGAYLARSSDRHAKACEDHAKAAAEGRFSPQTLYLVTDAELPTFQRSPQMTCVPSSQGYSGCVVR